MEHPYPPSQPMQWERNGEWIKVFSASVLTWPGLWSPSWGSGWFLAGVPGPNTNIPVELAPAPAYQKTDRKYESRRKTPWLTGRERGRGNQSELSRVRRQAGPGLKGDIRVIRVTRQAGCFSPFLVGILKWFIKKNGHYTAAIYLTLIWERKLK